MEIETNGTYDLITNGVQRVPITVNVEGSKQVQLAKVKVSGTTYTLSDLSVNESSGTYTATNSCIGIFLESNNTWSYIYALNSGDTVIQNSKYQIIASLDDINDNAEVIFYDVDDNQIFEMLIFIDYKKQCVMICGGTFLIQYDYIKNN